jgi:hypothetical protein
MVDHIYIVVENGDAYPDAYRSYASAVNAVKTKHKETLEDQIREVQCLDSIESILSDINVPENIEKGLTNLYIEKGINILIYKLPIS